MALRFMTSNGSESPDCVWKCWCGFRAVWRLGTCTCGDMSGAGTIPGLEFMGYVSREREPCSKVEAMST